LARRPGSGNGSLADEHMGLERVGDRVWNIVYYETMLGKSDERTRKIPGIDRCKGSTWTFVKDQPDRSSLA
jgi:hypothetical protein